MRTIRLLATLCCALLLTACADNLLPVRDVTGTWTSSVAHGSGVNSTSELYSLTLQPDGAFLWSRMDYGDGAGHPDMPVRRFTQFGQHRIRDGVLELRTDMIEVASGPALGEVERIFPDLPGWLGYWMRVRGDIMTLRFTTAPADAPIETTLVFRRDNPRPID